MEHKHAEKRRRGWVLASLLSIAAACAIAGQGEPTADLRAVDIDEDAVRDTATSIQKRYRELDASGYRLLTTEALDELSTRHGLEVVAIADVLASHVEENAADGLEPLLLAVAARIDASPDVKEAQRKAARTRLADAYNVDKEPPPNLYAPIVRPGFPLVHHVQMPFVRSALDVFMEDVAPTTMDEAFDSALCSEEGLAEIEARHGAAVRQQLEELCGGSSMGSLGGMSGSGMPSDLSGMDCFGEQEQSRADRINDLMRECAEAMMEGSDNPWAGDTTTSMSSTSGDMTSSTTSSTSDSMSTSSTSDSMSTSSTSSTSTTSDSSTLPPVSSEPIKYLIWGRDENGKAYEGFEFMDGTRAIQPSDGKDPAFANMQPGERKIIVIRWPNEASMGGPPSQPTPGEDPCTELELLLKGIDEEILENGPPLDPYINPNPDAEVDPEEEDCFGLGGGTAEIDDSATCVDELVLCEENYVPDADCNCVPQHGGVPDRPCGIYMMCLDGNMPDESCDCKGGEVEFVPVVPGPGGDPLAVEIVLDGIMPPNTGNPDAP